MVNISILLPLIGTSETIFQSHLFLRQYLNSVYIIDKKAIPSS